MNWALIKDGKVQNVIVADASYIDRIRSDFDECVEVDEDTQLEIGWSYADGQFSNADIVQAQRNQKLSDLRDARNVKLYEADVLINELVLQVRSNLAEVKAWRDALLEITALYKNENGDAISAIDEIDFTDEAFWPQKPE